MAMAAASQLTSRSTRTGRRGGAGLTGVRRQQPSTRRPCRRHLGLRRWSSIHPIHSQLASSSVRQADRNRLTMGIRRQSIFRRSFWSSSSVSTSSAYSPASTRIWLATSKSLERSLGSSGTWWVLAGVFSISMTAARVVCLPSSCLSSFYHGDLPFYGDSCRVYITSPSVHSNPLSRDYGVSALADDKKWPDHEIDNVHDRQGYHDWTLNRGMSCTQKAKFVSSEPAGER